MIINKEYLAKYSVLPLNYNYDEVMNYVDVAEKIWILPVLGYDWYEEIEYQVKNNSVSEENATALVEAIWPYLGFAIVYEALPSIIYHATEVSITKGHSDNSDALDLKELSYYQEHIRRQLEVRKDFCKKWICEHIDSFPLAVPCNCDCSSCHGNAKLNNPNPDFKVFKPLKKDTRLR